MDKKWATCWPEKEGAFLYRLKGSDSVGEIVLVKYGSEVFSGYVIFSDSGKSYDAHSHLSILGEAEFKEEE